MIADEYSPREIYNNLSNRQKALAGVTALLLVAGGAHEGVKYISESDERAATEKQHELDIKYGPTEPEGVHYWVDPENPILIDDGARLRSSPKVEPLGGDPSKPSNLYLEIPDAATTIDLTKGIYLKGQDRASESNRWVQISVEDLKNNDFLWTQISHEDKIEIEKDADGWIAINQQRILMDPKTLIEDTSGLNYTD